MVEGTFLHVVLPTIIAITVARQSLEFLKVQEDDQILARIDLPLYLSKATWLYVLIRLLLCRLNPAVRVDGARRRFTCLLQKLRVHLAQIVVF